MSADDPRPPSSQGDDDFGESRQPPRTAPAKPGASDTQDVFLLTGTTFAGTTDMNSTAGPNDTRPSTEAGRIETSLPIARIGEEGPSEDQISMSSTARHNRLLIEAELRAEHQAAARTTMLDLAHALDQSNNRAKELSKLLRSEYDNSAALREERDKFQAQVETLEVEEEKRLAQLLIDQALASGNKMVFGMLLEKSREGYEFDHFCPHKSAAAASAAATSESDAQPVIAKPKDMSEVFSGAVGDRVTASWVVKLWWREVEITKARLAKEREEEEKRRKAEEEARRIQEAKEKAVEEVRKMVRDLEGQLERARKLMEEQQKQNDKAEKELKEAREAAAREASAAKAREEALKAELTETKAEIAKTKSELAQLFLDYEESQEALRRADEAFSQERNQLKAVIRQVNSELHEAMVLAKHMRETALKAKRDAAGSVSPAKFAELIAQLESMKGQLSVLAKDCANEKESNSWLMRQLDKNKRQLELERQFLPLLRKVRGPVGPKVKGQKEDDGPRRSKTMDATQLQAPHTTMPPLAAGSSPNKLRMSQSMGALNDLRATAGGPLPGGRAGGLLDAEARFASSLGFASSNGQGTPLRG